MERQKSLRQLAKELGVSHSYLSQVIHGKRPASDKVQQAFDMVSMVSNNEAGIGLKIRRSNPCGFESLSRHQNRI
jgi:predicted transcriptional regulator